MPENRMRVKNKPLVTVTFNTWNCEFLLELINPQRAVGEIEAEIKARLFNYEQAFSRFLNYSELGRLNQGQTVEPSPLFIKVLQQAEALVATIKSDYFNPHVDLAAQGYDTTFDDLGLKKIKYSVTANIKAPEFPSGVHHQDNGLKLSPNVKLDFGSFLKGLVSAQIADIYAPDCDGLVVNFGGDLSVRGKDLEADTFAIGIYNPVLKKDHVVLLKNQSLCTSGSYKRTWTKGTELKHHITNPVLGTSSNSDYVSITFWGLDGAMCDALATAAFNAKPEVWKQWQQALPGVHYLAVHKSGEIITSTTF